MKADAISRFLLLSGSGIWLGALLMLGYGVAPVNFGVAKSWELHGQNPRMPDQTVTYRTVGGELTGNSIARLNQIESVCFLFLVIGLAVTWQKQTGSRKTRISATIIIFLLGILFYYYAVYAGGRLMEIRNTVPLDFSVSENALKSAVHLEFDRLHKAYTRTTSIAMLLLVSLFSIVVFGNQKQN
jgi:hypothetical protein